MEGKDFFKGMPSGKGKGKGDGKNKGGKPFQQQQPPQANVSQPASLVPHKPPKNKKLRMPKTAGVMTMTPIGQMTGQVVNPTMNMMQVTPKVIDTIGLTMLLLRN